MQIAAILIIAATAVLLVKRYQLALEGTGKEVGMHAHNNQQLAFANTI